MNNRPITVTLISLLFIIAGATGVYYHFKEIRNLNMEGAWILFIRLLAIVGGVFAFRGSNWARWLIMTWMVYHVVLSVFHTSLELIIHLGFSTLAYFSLFNKQASVYFKSKK